MSKLQPHYWDTLYKSGQTGWDIGYVSTPLKTYFDQLKHLSVRILVPGAGNGYEAEYLHKQGFPNVYLLDYAAESIKNFSKRYPDFPKKHLINEDFFTHTDQYDLIVEQTFFSSIPKERRNNYTEKMHQLLKPGGKLIGLLFNHEFNFQEPPFGGTENEYRTLFQPLFEIKKMEIAHNSIKPRAGRELFIILQKKCA
ncbi:MAG: methyltransferase domain-containing protein [Bacteroidetes bacterium]|nr:methyltransferase domain-containing protein [Bacteroidota bacterium]